MVGNEEIGVEGDLTVEWDEINLFSKRNYFRPHFGRKATWVSTLMRTLTTFLKGILPPKKFYRLNLIFWIGMGCGIAHFGRRGLKTTET